MQHEQTNLKLGTGNGDRSQESGGPVPDRGPSKIRCLGLASFPQEQLVPLLTSLRQKLILSFKEPSLDLLQLSLEHS